MDHTAVVACAVPANVALSYIEPADTGLVLASTTALTDEYAWYAGTGDTGASPTFRIRRVSDGYFFDFHDNTFRNSGWTTVAATMIEISSHLYTYTVTTTGFVSGWYDYLPDSPATISKPVAARVYFNGGILATGALSFADEAVLTSINTTTLNINQNTTASLKIAKNAYTLNPANGSITIYDNDGVTVLYSGLAYSDAAGTVLYNGTLPIHHTSALG